MKNVGDFDNLRLEKVEGTARKTHILRIAYTLSIC